MDENIKIFIIYIYSLSLGLKILIYWVKKTQIALLNAKKVIIFAKYSDFADVFPQKSAKMLPKLTTIHDHAIKLKK